MPPANAAESAGPPGLTYAASGVNLEEKDRFTESLVSMMRRTYGPRVIDNPGGFAGLFRLDFNQKLFQRNYKDPVLVACCDGVGTKVKLATDYNKFDTVGIDLVAMSVNDMIVQGAEPLFFLDYIAISRVDKPMLTDVVKGVAEGCRLAGCALLGGETAEMPDVYAPGEFDLAGFAVGVVELKRAIDPTRVEKGDVILGLASSGIHSNGYSLVRKIVKTADLDLHRVYPQLNENDTSPVRKFGNEPDAPAPKKTASDPKPLGRRVLRVNGNGAPSRRAESRGAPPGRSPEPTSVVEPTLGDALLAPTRIYVPSITRLLRQYKVKKIIAGMANITGSGLEGNLSRALHPGVDALIDPASWPVPPLFEFLARHGKVEDTEMRRVFNMGIGYTLIVRPAFAGAVQEKLEKLGEKVFVIGKVGKGKGEVRYV